ncbi:hypothetical protein AVEN_212211-1 [Araneus ventricosus]|uniref:Uncharacterized protein n=1 Tax=Araneus ventricosus TaxID=182803 RepID=A0A4Y2HTB6_ARAVE|nr:hypothetical protein AVEN_212211-1 [Araneus ventricosus]
MKQNVWQLRGAVSRKAVFFFVFHQLTSTPLKAISDGSVVVSVYQGAMPLAKSFLSRHLSDRTPPHAPVPDAITATEQVGWTWDKKQTSSTCLDRILVAVDWI